MIEVHFMILPDSLLMDWAGPAEALRIANQCEVAQGRGPRFAMHFVGPQTSALSSVGLPLGHLAPLPPLTVLNSTGSSHWVVVVGQIGPSIDLDTPALQTTLHWLRGLRLMAGQLELLCVCAGAVIAAKAGLLSGRKATTHHEHLAQLQHTDARCQVQANRVFVDDCPVYTSAGITTGIDLFLYRISAVCGPATAARVAQTMVVAQRRGPGDPELSPFLHHRQHLHAAVHRVQDAVSQSPSAPWSLAQMAKVACTSPRHLCRLFVQNTGITPPHYLRQIRLAVAQTALQNGQNVSQAAERAGFGSDTQLRRAWRAAGLAGTPSTFTA
jgi:transcriptional regulator GlxA family with amidase domain